MAWSIFTDGGGDGSAVTWAEDLLQEIGAPLTAGNEQFIYDWEKSEGGGGKYNPLNQGPVPGHPELTTTGQQYGGGAADYASWQAGLTGAADYLGMGNYTAIASDLKANNPAAARTALWDSPWASSHYGYGSMWSNAALPGKASALPGGSGVTGITTAQTTGYNPIVGGILGGLFNNPVAGANAGAAASDPLGLGALTSSLQEMALVVPLVLGGIGLVVLGVLKATNAKQHAENAAGTAAKVGEVAAL